MGRFRPLYLGRNRVLLRTRHGQAMYVPAHDLSLGAWLMLEGAWERAVTRVFLRALRPGMTVVDVGANVGWYTLLAARAVGPRGRVYAFEPDPQIAELLRDNVELNGYGDRVQVEEAALGATAGSATFYAAAKHRGNGSLVPGLNQLGDASAEITPFDVAVRRLDDYGAADVGLLKVDAEGGEANVFRGARETLARSPKLTAIVEFWPIFFTRAGEDAAAFLDARANEGFGLEQIDARRGRIVAARREAVLQRGSYELVFRR